LREGLPFLLPFASLVSLLVMGFTPTYAAGVAIVVVVLSSHLTRHHRMGGKALVEALALGSRNMIVTGLLLVAAGLIVGCLAMSGLAITFSQLLLGLAGESLPLLLVLVAFASLILGMGLPVTAAYLMLAILAAPALTALGVPLLAAHLIIFWLSQDSNVTPPLCLAAFAAAGIAEASPLQSGLQAWKIAKGLYVLPFLFAYTPLITGTWAEQLQITLLAALGLYAISGAISGYFVQRSAGWERLLLLGLGGMLLWPDWRGYLIGLGGLLALAAWQRQRLVDSE
jgi:TRAP transporter 4TM/12TM fusion protein